MGNQNNQNRNSQQTNHSLVDNNVGIEPVGVVYTLTSTDIADFVDKYLRDIKGISDLTGIKTKLIREGEIGGRQPEFSIYAFLPSNSQNIISDFGNIPESLRNRMDLGNVRASDQLYKALRPITHEFKMYQQKNLVYTHLSAYRVIGMMLDLNPNEYEIILWEGKHTRKREFALSIMVKKRAISPVNTGGNRDQMDEIIDRIGNR